MKKRTLFVSFLIFTLCVFHSLTPGTALAQEDASLAQQVFDEHKDTLLRDDVKVHLPPLLDGLKESPLDIPTLIDTAITLVTSDPTGATLKGIAAAQGITLTDDHIALIADADVQAVLKDDTTVALLSLKGDELSAALDELAALIAASTPTDPGDGTTDPGDGTTDPGDGTTDPGDGTTDPGDGTTDPGDGTTDPGDGTTDPGDGTTDPGDGTTDPGDGTTDPGDGTTDPGDGTTDPVELVTSNLNGESRLGGLSLNRVHGRAFIRDMIAAAGLSRDLADEYVDDVVDIILSLIPDELNMVFPKKQVRQTLTANNPTSIFQIDEKQLDYESFGNAITPSLLSVLFNQKDPFTQKYLTSDNLNLYVRVPSTLEKGRVEFRVNNRKMGDGSRITPDKFQADTIPYTFRLDESLAATNLPSWPALGNQLFSSVALRYSQEGLNPDGISLGMDSKPGKNGVVWEKTVGIIPGRNVYYWFEVTLVEPVMLELINPEAVYEALNNKAGTHNLNPTNQYEISKWSMPDPNNLQYVDNGILKDLISDEVRAEIIRIGLPQLGNPASEFNITGKDFNKLQQLLLRNANSMFKTFESTFDPKIASVFTVPKVDVAKQSLWYANIDSIEDSMGQPSKIEAVVYNAYDDAVDRIAVNINVDTTPPTANIVIETPDIDAPDAVKNTAFYQNNEGIFVATAPDPSMPSILNIETEGAVGVGQAQGYLLYQLIKLDAAGYPVGTWLPLTVENSMLASDVWSLIQEELEGQTDPNIQLVAGLSLEALLNLLSANLAGLAGPFLADLGIKLSDEQVSLIGNIIGAAIQDVNLIPLVFDPNRSMGMPIQGEGMQLLTGDYGIRALGIDTVFNVGSHVGPTRLRIVDPEIDTSSVTAASLGDINHNGKVDPYENGYLYSNTDSITLTVTLNERSVHPGEIMVQYQNADGVWVTIDTGTLELAEATGTAGDTLPVVWDDFDFQELVAAGDYVAIQTVTTNKLNSSHTSEMFKIHLDNDVHPVDPEVLIVDVDGDSIVMTNQDSGAPQGTINLIGYTPRRSVPATSTIRIEAKRANDEEWTMIGTVEGEAMELTGTDTAAVMFNGNTFADVYTVNMLHIQDSGSYLKWTVAVDTTAIEDTITKDSPAARDASLDDNKYMVRAYAVGDDGSDISDAVEGEMYTDTFSVDNDDDVAPLGPTNVVGLDVAGKYTVNEDHGDGTYTVGGLTDKYDPNVDSPVITLTLKPEAGRTTYAGVKLITTLPEDAIIGEVTETAEGSGEFTVTIDIGTLMDADELAYNDRYLQDPDDMVYNPTDDEVYTFTAHALAYDKAAAYDDATAADDMFLTYGNRQADDYDDDEITVNVQNSYRPDPGVLAITVENSDGMTNADSGAPKYELTFNAYTYGLTSPPTEGVRFEVKRPGDETWERIPGTDEPPEEIDSSDLAGIVTGLVQITEHNTVSDGETEFAIPGSFHKWSVTVDTRELARLGENRPDTTITLDDTIERGDAAERDASLDDNQYQVRAISLTPKNMAHTEYHQRDGVDAHFSLDNVDDMPPLGPTNITDVADVAGSIDANEDGSYTVGGIVDPTVDTPVAIFTVEPTAEPITYEGGSIRVVQTDADGNIAEADGSLEDGTVMVDVGQLANGTYQYSALTIDAYGNVQDDGSSPSITVHVLNIRVSDITDLTVTAVDDEPVEGELPETIPLRDSISVSFNVNNGSLMVDDLTGILVDGHRVMYTAGSDAENSFSLMADELGSVVDGWYTPEGEITKRNGSVTFALATINLDNTGPMVMFVTPGEGDTVNDLPTLQATYNDGDLGVGVSAENTAVVSLARLRPNSDSQEEIPIDVDQGMVEQDGDSVVYTRIDKLAGGAYKFSVQVNDSLGNIGNHSVAFAVEGINPSVVITAPASGQQFNASPASITGFYAGGGEVNITKFMVNDADVTADVDGNNFTYMPDGGFSEGDHNVSVEVTDGSGLTSQTGLTFTITLPVPTVAILSPEPTQVYNHGTPIITGEFSGADPVMVALSIDGEAVEVETSGNQFSYTPEMELSHGEHTVTAEVTDANGKTAMTSTIFTVDIPGPTVSIHSPAPGQTYDHGMPILQGEFSGVEASVAVTVNGEAIPVVVDGNEFTFTPPVGIGDGEYTVVAVATDANGKTAKATVVFSVSLPVPTVTIQTPTAGQILDHGKPVISGNFSGADEIVVAVTIDGDAVEASVNDNNEFTYTSAEALSDGEHTITVEVTDGNGRTAQTSSVFTVDISGPTVAILSPASGQIYDNGSPVVTGEFTGVAPVEVKLSINGEDAEVKNDGNQFTHDLDEALGHGDHTISAEVTDANGKTAQATTVFTVDIPGPSISILSPASGQSYDHGAPVIRVEFMGSTDVDVTAFTLNGEDAEGEVEDNQLTYTPDPVLGDGEHTIVVEVTDANNKTAEASVVFSVMRDNTPPVIAAYSPTGVVRLNKADVVAEDMGVTISADISDPESDLLSVKYLIDDTAPTHSYPVDHAANKFEVTHSFTPGTHSITLIVESEGGSKEFSWKFTVEVDEAPPAISHITPSGTVHAGLPTISASATDDTGVEEISITLMDSEGKEVKGSTSDDAEDRANEGITRLDFNPDEPLEEGTYTISVRATDGYGNSSTAKGSFTVAFDTAAPIITMASPQNGSRLTYKHDEERKPNISVAYSDAGTGINPDSIRFVFNDDLINLTSKQKSASQVNYTPPADLEPGKYVVKLEVSDNAHQQGNVSEKKEGAREANTAVYEFSFFVEHGDTPIMWAAPFNYPNPFSKNTRISLVLARRANVSITIFDSTLRPVRVLVDNEVIDAGNYTKNPAGAGSNAFGWDGKSSGGEDLARGIYFCQIEVNDGIEPEFAILKLALTR